MFITCNRKKISEHISCITTKHIFIFLFKASSKKLGGEGGKRRKGGREQGKKERREGGRRRRKEGGREGRGRGRKIF